VSWGLDNRECGVRVASPFRGREAESTNVELKTCDPTCNPYLALGGLIHAGDGSFLRHLEAGIRAALPAARIRPLTVPPVVGAALLGLDRLGAVVEARAVLRRSLTRERLTAGKEA
jgi:hypothetical protein